MHSLSAPPRAARAAVAIAFAGNIDYNISQRLLGAEHGGGRLPAEEVLMEKSGRIELMDALRGLAVCLMVLHHFLYDLCAFLGAPWVLFTNPVFDVLHYIFAGLFIFLSGVSSDFSRSNFKRGVKAMVLAMGITLVTWLMGMTVVFGVLHLLASCMLLFALTRRFWEKLPAFVVPALSAALVVLTARCANGVPTQTPHLWIFGFTTPDFASSDYFPLLPWFFVFLFGTWAGRYVRAGRLPDWFYRAKAPRLALVGRHALPVYVLHQPVLYGITMLLSLFIR